MDRVKKPKVLISILGFFGKKVLTKQKLCINILVH